MSFYPPGGLWVNSGQECEEIVGDIGARGHVNWSSDREIILCDGCCRRQSKVVFETEGWRGIPINRKRGMRIITAQRKNPLLS